MKRGLSIGTGPSGRTRWRTNSYHDGNSEIREQVRRHKGLVEEGVRDPDKEMTFFDCLQGIGSMNMNRGIKVGSNPIEIYKHMSFKGKYFMYGHMLHYYRNIQKVSPKRFREVHMKPVFKMPTLEN